MRFPADPLPTARALAVALLLPALPASADPAELPPPEGNGAEIYQSVCATCHGPAGEGNKEVLAPSIAHLPAWYVVPQLKNFADGKRGVVQQDPQGIMMAAIAKTLSPGKQVAVAQYVESLDLVPPAEREIEGADLGEGLYLFQSRCMECHRYNASGEMAFGSPPLVGRQGWYLSAQLKKFQDGHRGFDADDVNGAKMAENAALFINSEQALKDVVGYILSLNPEPTPEPEETKEKKRSPFWVPGDETNAND